MYHYTLNFISRIKQQCLFPFVEEEPEKKVDETEKSGTEGEKVDAEGTSMEKEEVAEKTMDVELIKEVENVPSPMMMVCTSPYF